MGESSISSMSYCTRAAWREKHWLQVPEIPRSPTHRSPSHRSEWKQSPQFSVLTASWDHQTGLKKLRPGPGVTVSTCNPSIVFGRMRQEDNAFEASWITVRPCLKNKTKQTWCTSPAARDACRLVRSGMWPSSGNFRVYMGSQCWEALLHSSQF